MLDKIIVETTLQTSLPIAPSHPFWLNFKKWNSFFQNHEVGNYFYLSIFPSGGRHRHLRFHHSSMGAWWWKYWRRWSFFLSSLSTSSSMASSSYMIIYVDHLEMVFIRLISFGSILVVFDTLVFYVNEYFVELNNAKFKFLNLNFQEKRLLNNFWNWIFLKK